MKTPMKILALIFLLFGIAQSVTASAQTLEEAVWNMLSPATLDLSVLDDEAEILVASGSTRQFYAKEDIKAYLLQAKTAGVKYEASDFDVISKDESRRFASIAYRVTWKTTMGNTTTSTRLTSHEIWERQPSGWRRVFGAMEQ